jgi:hypothetical protein
MSSKKNIDSSKYPANDHRRIPDNYRSNVQQSDDHQSNVRQSNIQHSNVRHSNVRHSNVRHSNVRHSNVRHSDVQQSNIRHSNVQHSNVRHSDVQRSDVRQLETIASKSSRSRMNSDASNIQEYKIMGTQSMISGLIEARTIVTAITTTISNIITTVKNGLIYETKRHQQLKTVVDSKTSIEVDETVINDRKNKNNREEIESTEAHILSVHSTIRGTICGNNLTKPDGEYEDRYYQDKCNKQTISLDTTDLNPIEMKVFENYENNNKLTVDSMSFSGGGYNCMYHMGVIKYIFENLNLFKDAKYLGASGGAGVISMILCFENDPERFTILNEAIEDVIGMKQLNLSLRDQVKVYSSNLMKHITRERFDRYIKNSNRCHISVTDVSSIVPYNTIKTNFSSYEQFIDTIKASACVPVILDDRIRVVDNRSYLDGGLSNNLPCLDDKTIRISCLNYPLLVADIYPKIIFDMKHCFIPPDRNYILNMHDLGYNDIDMYMREKKDKLIAFEKESDFNKCITNIINDPAFTDDKNIHNV